MTEIDRLPVFAVVLAGGSGTRLWPLARASRPKQFLRLPGGRSLFQQACQRAASVAGRSGVVVVAGRTHAGWIRRQAPWIPPGRVIVEGVGRNTAASVALAAHWIRLHRGDGVMAVIPADHHIAPTSAFRAGVRRAAGVARRTGDLVVLGVRAVRPETGFGYIRPASGASAGGTSRVREFVEKPGPARARRMVAGGTHLWNSGLFVWKSSSILGSLTRFRPRLARSVARVVPSRATAPWRIPARGMRGIEAASIDTAVLEKSKHLRVVRATFRWSDLGNWNAWGDCLRQDARGNRSQGRILSIGATRCITVNPGGVTVLVGVRDLVVVRDAGAVMVCARDAVQRVRQVQALLRGSLSTHA